VIVYADEIDTEFRFNNFVGNETNAVLIIGERIGGWDENCMQVIPYINIPYYVSGTIDVYDNGGSGGGGDNTARLLIEPNVVLNFFNNAGLNVAVSAGSYQKGALTADSVIFTTAQSPPSSGNWNGLKFGGQSYQTGNILTNSVVEYGGAGSSNANIFLNNSIIDTFTNTIIRFSSGYGIYINNVYADFKIGPNLTIINNDSGAIYNNSSANIDADSNYWGVSDTNAIETLVYHKIDNPSLGQVYFSNFTPVADTIAPSTITNLSVSIISNTSVLLTWTAPGDDGYSGTANYYELKYSENEINSSNFYSANSLSAPLPLISGNIQNCTVLNLMAGQIYYFAIKAVDESGNKSNISNVIYITLPLPQTFTLSGVVRNASDSSLLENALV
ncbi:MAG TPA: fibronectin type III domain-containing protein, partial [bacterium]|nr:fibronectin type III domain-containing protein [bacterium]